MTVYLLATVLKLFCYNINTYDNKLSNEFIIESKMNKLAETDAIKSLIEFIGNSILVGHHVDFDVEMINVALEKLDCGRLKMRLWILI
jgi:DNA polymerase-3 subunit epsilon